MLVLNLDFCCPRFPNDRITAWLLLYFIELWVLVCYLGWPQALRLNQTFRVARTTDVLTSSTSAPLLME